MTKKEKEAIEEQHGVGITVGDPALEVADHAMVDAFVKQFKADAQLRQAAPDLLDACKQGAAELLIAADLVEHPATDPLAWIDGVRQRLLSAAAKATVILFCILSLTACEISKGGSSITAPESVTPGEVFAPQPSSDLRALATLTGVAWTGVETADVGHGENGELNATFYTAGQDGYVSARLQFKGRLETVNGSLSGTLDNLSIVADPGGTPTGTRCDYSARGARTEETERGGGLIEVISGRYQGRGGEPSGNVCPTKAGTFRLQRPLLPPPCVGGATYAFIGQQLMAVLPPLWPNPELYPPFALPAVPFSVPAGTWQFSAVTGSGDSQSDAQIVKFMLYGAGDQLLATVGPTVNVPAIQTTISSNLGTVTLTQSVLMMKAIHGYTGMPVASPTHSVFPVSLTYSCPAVR